MSELVYLGGVSDDLDRIATHLVAFDAAEREERIAEILSAMSILRKHPLIGRPVSGNKRELVIGRGSRGYIALYRFDPHLDVVIVTAIRSQRESGFSQEP
ncbi:MAG: type II toxin-antitoxin system RelE/ParE family toxin [Myxococcales bacterium]|nr:type II toxin-antitoxin system RelE/ParE family toxin [Myxococcales bacterium]MDP3501967.1 type II toxin-antitoxin system RelE/ParE family toxin [Myxococcales bacterium]